MQGRSSISQYFKNTNVPSVKDLRAGTEEETSRLRQFVSRFEEFLVALLLYAILLSAILQPLFRDELLGWLRSILERTY